jgi:hypothetical protein
MFPILLFYLQTPPSPSYREQHNVKFFDHVGERRRKSWEAGNKYMKNPTNLKMAM